MFQKPESTDPRDRSLLGRFLKAIFGAEDPKWADESEVGPAGNPNTGGQGTEEYRKLRDRD
jgi:hypothetical protein